METDNSTPARPRIYADFNELDGDGHIWWLVLTCQGTWDDLARLNLQLSEGLEVTFYMDDADKDGNPGQLEVDGHCHFDVEKNYWVGMLDSATRHVPEKKTSLLSNRWNCDS